MLVFKILSGKRAGDTWSARRFPVRVGRSPEADLSIEESGVWERHLEIEFDRSRGIVLHSAPESLTRVNDEQVTETVLRSGDVIHAGSLKLQFWLAPTRQRGMRSREWFTWALIAIVSLGQVALVYLFRYWEQSRVLWPIAG